MESALLHDAESQKNWRIFFIIFSILILIILPLLSRDYGQTGDEWLQIIYGSHIWNYFAHGDPRALNYDDMGTQFKGQELYGGFFDFGAELLHRMLPSVPLLILRHCCNAVTSALMMIFTGLLAFRLSRQWLVAVVALLFMVFSPRIFGEGMNNPKDIPFASGFIIAVYFSVALMQDAGKNSWRHAVGLALGFGMAFGVRSAGGLLLIAYLMVIIAGWLWFHKPFRQQLGSDKKLRNRLVFFFAGSLIAGYIIGLLFWPWGLQSPISNPIESLKGMTNRETVVSTLFEGKYYLNYRMPWYYEFKWILISTPLIIVAGILVFVPLIPRVKNQYGWFSVLLPVFGAFFPLLYMIYKHSSVYDTWRHVFFVYPFWVLMAVLGWDALSTFIRKERLRWIPAAVAMAGLLPAIVWTVRSHPNQYVYFNELVGGLKGAYGHYETDYYQNSGKQAAEWIAKQGKPAGKQYITVLSNMAGFGPVYFPGDTSWIHAGYGRYNQRHAKDWDYYVTYSRYVPIDQLQNGAWPAGNVVHRVEVDGVPLSAVLRRNPADGPGAGKAFEQKDYATAAVLYADYVKNDSTDEFAWLNYGIALASTGQMDAAVGALQHATRLDASNPQYLDILAQVYQAKGDAAAAQQAHNKAASIAAEQQEDETEE